MSANDTDASPHDHGHHDHPETFAEVIERGFPLEDLHKELRIRAVAPAVAEEILAGPQVVPIRRDQRTLSDELKTAFRAAVGELVREGTYATLVRHHMDMSHNMHGSMGFIGLLRFLAWHRRYLVEFERHLQRVDAVLRPNGSETLSIPYWRWPDDFPAWLVNFLPQADPESGTQPPPRRLSSPPRKPTGPDVSRIFSDYPDALRNEPVNDYVRFTYTLEGWFRQPDGPEIPAHNHVHDWVGGIMGNTRKSPTDPIFWLHHAEVDRLWHIWQLRVPNVHPPLTGTSQIMDPWTETYADLIDIAALGYQFESLVP